MYNETSRVIAMNWWNDLDDMYQATLIGQYYPGRLTVDGLEIEKIYNKIVLGKDENFNSSLPTPFSPKPAIYVSIEQLESWISNIENGCAYAVTDEIKNLLHL